MRPTRSSEEEAEADRIVTPEGLPDAEANTMATRRGARRAMAGLVAGLGLLIVAVLYLLLAYLGGFSLWVNT